MAKLKALTEFLDRLDAADLHYAVSSISEGAVLVSVMVPGERWEVEFPAEGDVNVELFESDGKIREASALKKLFDAHGAQ